MSVWSYFGGPAKAIARLWIIAFYVFLWLGPNNYDTNVMAQISRVGLMLLFLSDIVPTAMAIYQRRRAKRDCPCQ